jgi:hypothetical protein
MEPDKVSFQRIRKMLPACPSQPQQKYSQYSALRAPVVGTNTDEIYCWYTARSGWAHSPKQGTPDSARTLELEIGRRRAAVNRIIWIIGAIVVVLAILSFLGLR